MRTQISSEDAARIYKSSGGAYDQSDSVGVCVPTYDKQQEAAANAGFLDSPADGYAIATLDKLCQAGITLDSGIAERCKTLYALLEKGGGSSCWRYPHLASVVSGSGCSVEPVAGILGTQYQPLQEHPSRNPTLLRGWSRFLD